MSSDSPLDAAVDARHVDFHYITTNKKRRKVLRDATFELKKGTRTILIGANGAGKSTLLRVIAGKHLLQEPSKVTVLGKSAFHQTIGENGLSYLGNSWTRTIAFAGASVAYQADIPVRDMSRLTQEEFPERRDELFKLLDIDPNWRMHEVSDGQRRRVQIMLGLLRPFDLLLVDEMTTDLDCLGRKAFLGYLSKECETRDATVLYATHIFDALNDWPTHLMYMDDGKVLNVETVEDSGYADKVGGLHQHVVDFLTERSAVRKTIADDDQNVEVLEHDRWRENGYSSGRMASVGFKTQSTKAQGYSNH